MRKWSTPILFGLLVFSLAVMVFQIARYNQQVKEYASALGATQRDLDQVKGGLNQANKRLESAGEDPVDVPEAAAPSSVPGPAGQNGPPGPPGASGLDGADGENGTQGQQGDAGQNGSPGAGGPTGAPGAQGPAGPEGPQGEIGPAGPPGKDGKDGADGKDGSKGEQGEQGKSGEKGDPGKDGTILKIECVEGPRRTKIELSDGTIYYTLGCTVTLPSTQSPTPSGVTR